MSAGQGPVGGSMSADELRRARKAAELAAVDWPERFRRAALVCDGIGLRGQAMDFRTLAAEWHMFERPEAAAVGRALLGEDV